MTKHHYLFLSSVIAVVFGLTNSSHASVNPIELTKRSSENQIKNLIEPVLEKFCREECKLLTVSTVVDANADDLVSPGFDDFDISSTDRLAPSAASVKLLIDEKVGPLSRQKLLDLIEQYLDTLDYPVKIDVQVKRFPQPIGSAARVAELREKISKKFKQTLEDLFNQFCPHQCLLADYDLRTELVNEEEAQYGSPGEFYQDSGTALRIKNISSTILVDEVLTPEVQNNILEMARLKTNSFKNVTLNAKSLRFPRPMVGEDGYVINGYGRGLASLKSTKNENTSQSTSTQNNRNNTNQNSNSQSTENLKSNSSENNQETTQRQERFERFEKIERVENGDAVQAELKKFGMIGLIFACSILSLLVLIAVTAYRASKGSHKVELNRILGASSLPPLSYSNGSTENSGSTGIEETGETRGDPRISHIAIRYEIEQLMDELTKIFAEQPKVAKHVFSRVLTEMGVDTTAHYIHIFGEGVVIDLLRDPSLQADVAELMEYYAKHQFEISDSEKIDLLKQLHNRTVAAKLWVMGSRSSNLFDFLSEMDATQVMELIRTESLTVKAIILTQCDPQKRTKIYSTIDDQSRMKLLTELSRIDYLPRDYIFNVANALKRKRKENPKLNTEALPGSEVLITLLERTSPEMQTQVFRSLEATNPDSARIVKAKLVSIETLRFLREGQLLEVILSLRHDELLQFLKGTTPTIQGAVVAKTPKELVAELQEELEAISVPNRETYQVLERKIINRMKSMAADGLINLIETNERMFSEAFAETQFTENSMPLAPGEPPSNVQPIRKVAGW